MNNEQISTGQTLWKQITAMNTRTKLFWVCICLILCGGIFLRLYRIPEYLTFLSDQGRDAIILKRIVTLEKFVFVGPTTSIGNVFTGPFFYYLVAPFMLLSRWDPAGPAYGIAILNTLGLVLAFAFVYRHFGKIVSITFLILITFAANQVWQSRFSWNPNPVSTFSFLALAAYYQAYTTRKRIWYIATGILVGCSMQLHYLTILLLLPIGLHAASDLIRAWTRRTHSPLLPLILAKLAGIATFTPLILFDIKNKFINLKALLNTTSSGEVQAKNFSYLFRFTDTLQALWKNAFATVISVERVYLLSILLSIAIILILIRSYHDHRRSFIIWCLLVVASFIPVFAILETGRHVHYYNHVYYALYFLLALTISNIIHRIGHPLSKWMLGGALTVAAIFFVLSQVSQLHYLTDKPKEYTQLSDAKDVAKAIIAQLDSDSYQVVGLPYYETEGHYRYYLEYFGRRPMPADTLGDPTELYVICHEKTVKDCQIAGNAQWQLADFQNRHPDWKQISQKEIAGVWIVKIVQ